jgi:hypothetical protein
MVSKTLEIEEPPVLVHSKMFQNQGTSHSGLFLKSLKELANLNHENNQQKNQQFSKNVFDQFLDFTRTSVNIYQNQFSAFCEKTSKNQQVF